MKKVTIIVPVYNVQDYLNRCIDSLTNQTYKNIEIFLVDDGSTDNSGAICDNYKKNDKRIKVIHKKNGGQSDARNCALDKMTGDYVAFVDSDDYVDNDYIEYMMSLITNDDSDVAICSYKAIYENGSIISQANGNKYILNAHDTIEKTLYHEDFNVSAWAKLYRADYFNNVRFPVGKIFEEVETLYKVFLKCDKISVGLESKYNYMIRANSTLTCAFSEKKLYLTEAYDNMGEAVLAVYPDLYSGVIRARVYSRISTLRQMIYSKPRLKTKEKEYRKFVLDNKKEIFKNKRVAKRDKIACFLLSLGIEVFKIGWFVYCKFTGREYL